MLDEEARKLELAAFNGVFSLIDEGKSQHLLKELPNNVLVSFLIGAANQMVSLWRSQNVKPSSKQLKEAFLLLWHGIRA
jgi:hypothetical protein